MIYYIRGGIAQHSKVIPITAYYSATKSEDILINGFLFTVEPGKSGPYSGNDWVDLYLYFDWKLPPIRNHYIVKYFLA